ALRVLKEVDLIACEDTRRTRRLLAHFGITTPLTSYFEHNKLKKGASLLRLLSAGKSVALVSDAGTPTISDPGSLLVSSARAAGIPVVPIPGPSALSVALSASGIPANRFVFEGFLPAKPGRRLSRLKALRALETTVVLYEGPHRLVKTLVAIREVFGEISLVVARELTKQFEEIRAGTPEEHLAHFRERQIRGEFTLVIPAACSTPEAGIY
ncbi:MAG: 16S rRNA (cytidine(1402)-2'-O)-methyltransferase, partial [Candidatus Methylomirabilia bacterium]